jgi:hypothetical protein
MNKSFFDEIKNNSKKANKDIHHFKLYVNGEYQDFWDFVDTAEKNGITPSTAICYAIRNEYNRGVIQELIKEKSNPETIENLGVIKTLVKVANHYNMHSVDGMGSDLAKGLSRKFYEGSLSPIELIDLMVFALELNAVVTRTDLFKKFVRENPGLLLESVRDFNNPEKAETFKQELKNQFFVDIDLFESEKKEAELKEQQRQHWEIRKAEITKWEAENYPKKWSERNMTQDDKDYLKRLLYGDLVWMNGKYILIDHTDDSEDNADDFNGQAIKTDISDI